MSSPVPFSSSPDLASAPECALALIDVQQRLLPAIDEGERATWNCSRLARAALLTEIPLLVTEQYSKGLGGTVEGLTEFARNPIEKLTFSAWGAPDFRRRVAGLDRRQIVVAGIETHVCVLQTALDLVAAGYSVLVAVDACGSRFAVDHKTALRRMEAAGVTLATTESMLFEWCRTAESPVFKQIAAIVREAQSGD